jgi:hypothetical protein
MGNQLSSFSGWLNTCVKLVNYYVNKKYTLPYTGGMVLDVNQVHMIFTLLQSRKIERQNSFLRAMKLITRYVFHSSIS